MSAFTLGGALIQLPLGRLSDHMDRRLIIAGVAVAAAAAGIALSIFGSASKTAALALVAVFGMVCLPVYGLSVAHANDRLPREMFVESSATLLLINALASTVGPVIAASVTARFGMASLFLYTASIHVGLAIFTVARIRMAAAAPLAAHEQFEPMPQQSSPTALELDPRGPEHARQPEAA